MNIKNNLFGGGSRSDAMTIVTVVRTLVPAKMAGAMAAVGTSIYCGRLARMTT